MALKSSRVFAMRENLHDRFRHKTATELISSRDVSIALARWPGTFRIPRWRLRASLVLGARKHFSDLSQHSPLASQPKNQALLPERRSQTGSHGNARSNHERRLLFCISVKLYPAFREDPCGEAETDSQVNAGWNGHVFQILCSCCELQPYSGCAAHECEHLSYRSSFDLPLANDSSEF